MLLVDINNLFKIKVENLQGYLHLKVKDTCVLLHLEVWMINNLKEKGKVSD